MATTTASGTTWSKKFTLAVHGVGSLGFIVSSTTGAPVSGTMTINVNGQVLKTSNFTMTSIITSATLMASYNNP